MPSQIRISQVSGLSTQLSTYLTTNQNITLTGDLTGSGNTSIASTITSNAITYTKFQQVNSSKLLGNPTGSLANVREITLGSSLSFSSNTLQTNALTGDVTSSTGSFSTTIANNAVTLAKMANLTALSVMGNATSSVSTPTAITGSASSLLSINSNSTTLSFTTSPTVSGTMTAGTFVPTSTSAPSNGLYLSASNSLGLSSNNITFLSYDIGGNIANVNKGLIITSTVGGVTTAGSGVIHDYNVGNARYGVISSIGLHTFYNNTFTYKLLTIQSSGTVANSIVLTATATTIAPTIAVLGDANIGLSINSAGNADMTINSGASTFVLKGGSSGLGQFSNGITVTGLTGSNPSTSSVTMDLSSSTTARFNLNSATTAIGYNFYTDNYAAKQFSILRTASATNCITVSGSNGGSPSISTSAGDLTLTSTTGNVLVPTVAGTTDASTKAASTNFVQNVLAQVYTTQFGSFINKFLNGTFDIVQLGTSGNITVGTTSYTLDGWVISVSGSGGATINWSQTQNSLFGYPYYGLRITGNTNITDVQVFQYIESLISAPLNGTRVTVQYMINNNTGSGLSPTLTVQHASAQDNFSTLVTDVNAVSLQTISNNSTGIVAYSFTASAGSINGLKITLDFGNSLNSNAKTVQIVGADIRMQPNVALGLNNSPPVMDFRPFPIEFTYAQRYLEKSYEYPTVPGTANTGVPLDIEVRGTSSGGGYMQFTVPFKVEKRVAPTMTIYSYANATVGNASNDLAADYAVNVTGAGTWAYQIGGFIPSGRFGSEHHFVASARF